MADSWAAVGRFICWWYCAVCSVFYCGSCACSLMILLKFFRLDELINEKCKDGNDLNINYRRREIEICNYFQLSQLGTVLGTMG